MASNSNEYGSSPWTTQDYNHEELDKEMEIAVQKADDENRGLRGHISLLEKELDSTKSKLRGLNKVDDENRMLHGDNRRLHCCIRSLENELDSAKSKLSEAESLKCQQTRFQQENSKLRDENLKLTNKGAQLERDKRKLQDEVYTLTSTARSKTPAIQNNNRSRSRSRKRQSIPDASNNKEKSHGMAEDLEVEIYKGLQLSKEAVKEIMHLIKDGRQEYDEIAESVNKYTTSGCATELCDLQLMLRALREQCEDLQTNKCKHLQAECNEKTIHLKQPYPYSLINNQHRVQRVTEYNQNLAKWQSSIQTSCREEQVNAKLESDLRDTREQLQAALQREKQTRAKLELYLEGVKVEATTVTVNAEKQITELQGLLEVSQKQEQELKMKVEQLEAKQSELVEFLVEKNNLNVELHEQVTELTSTSLAHSTSLTQERNKQKHQEQVICALQNQLERNKIQSHEGEKDWERQGHDLEDILSQVTQTEHTSKIQVEQLQTELSQERSSREKTDLTLQGILRKQGLLLQNKEELRQANQEKEAQLQKLTKELQEFKQEQICKEVEFQQLTARSNQLEEEHQQLSEQRERVTDDEKMWITENTKL